MENKKNTILLSVIAVATLLVAVVGASFAYFTATGGTAVSKNVNVITGTAGSSSFEVSGAISIYADATNFASGKGDKSGSATGTVKFTAPSAVGGTIADADLKFCYSVTVNITSNDFVYSVNTTTPELILDVTKGSTKVVDTMDITTKTGAIQVPTAKDGKTYIHTITATAGQSLTENWNVVVTLKNLAADQNKNTGKSLAGTLRFAHVDCTSGAEI